MDELPEPDLRDHRGRLHRILIALGAGFACGALGWWLAAKGAGAGADYERGSPGAGKFIFMTAGIGLFFGYQLTLKLLEHVAKRTWDREQMPEARVVKK